MTGGRFDGESFFAVLDAARQAKKFTWKKVAVEANISASTLTRLAQGRRPDVDSLAALCKWASISADRFFLGETTARMPEPLTEITALLRADQNLSAEASIALDTILKTAYERLRKEN